MIDSEFHDSSLDGSLLRYVPIWFGHSANTKTERSEQTGTQARLLGL